MGLDFLQHGVGRMLLLMCFGMFVIALVLQVVGFIVPGWVVWNDDDYTLNRGVWYYKECKNDTCSSSAYDTDQKDADISGVSRDMVSVQLRTTLGLVFTIVSVIACGIGIKLLGDNKLWGVHILTVAWSINGGIGGTALSVAISFGLKVLDSHNSLGDQSKMESPFGVLLTGIGTCFAVLAGLIGGCIAVYAWCCHKSVAPNGDRTDSYELPKKHQPV